MNPVPERCEEARDMRLQRAAGAALASVRRSQSVSLETLAQRVGSTYQQLMQYERGETRISLARYVAIAHALGRDPAELLATIIGPRADHEVIVPIER